LPAETKWSFDRCSQQLQQLQNGHYKMNSALNKTKAQYCFFRNRHKFWAQQKALFRKHFTGIFNNMSLSLGVNFDP
jgi:hypothetical protein